MNTTDNLIGGCKDQSSAAAQTNVAICIEELALSGIFAERRNDFRK
jgi:hypothetical protein